MMHPEPARHRRRDRWRRHRRRSTAGRTCERCCARAETTRARVRIRSWGRHARRGRWRAAKQRARCVFIALLEDGGLLVFVVPVHVDWGCLVARSRGRGCGLGWRRRRCWSRPQRRGSRRHRRRCAASAARKARRTTRWRRGSGACARCRRWRGTAWRRQRRTRRRHAARWRHRAWWRWQAGCGQAEQRFLPHRRGRGSGSAPRTGGGRDARPRLLGEPVEYVQVGTALVAHPVSLLSTVARNRSPRPPTGKKPAHESCNGRRTTGDPVHPSEGPQVCFKIGSCRLPLISVLGECLADDGVVPPTLMRWTISLRGSLRIKDFGVPAARARSPRLRTLAPWASENTGCAWPAADTRLGTARPACP